MTVIRSDTARRTRTDGERTRRLILDTAVRLATIEGLDGLSIGTLAHATQLSKSGVYAHFDSKAALQLATIDSARALFIDVVVAPVLERGRARASPSTVRVVLDLRRKRHPPGRLLLRRRSCGAGRPARSAA